MIDSTLFGVDLPAGAYTAGSVVQLKLIDGPGTVRTGRGQAVLKKITSGIMLDASGTDTYWRIYVKNSDWVDPAISLSACMRKATALDEKSGCVQRGHDCPLTPNSAWEVWAECITGTTTTVANSLFALIDVDYPEVSSIVDPDTLVGIPASIELKTTGTPLKAAGTLVGSAADVVNVDFFKAGYMYSLEKIEAMGNAAFEGFISMSNAAGMGGLKRIMPFASTIDNIRDKVSYASKLVKGPMDIGFNLFANAAAATTGNLTVVMDFVKRRM